MAERQHREMNRLPNTPPPYQVSSLDQPRFKLNLLCETVTTFFCQSDDILDGKRLLEEYNLRYSHKLRTDPYTPSNNLTYNDVPYEWGDGCYVYVYPEALEDGSLLVLLLASDDESNILYVYPVTKTEEVSGLIEHMERSDLFGSGRSDEEGTDDYNVSWQVLKNLHADRKLRVLREWRDPIFSTGSSQSRSAGEETPTERSSTPRLDGAMSDAESFSLTSSPLDVRPPILRTRNSQSDGAENNQPTDKRPTSKPDSAMSDSQSKGTPVDTAPIPSPDSTTPDYKSSPLKRHRESSLPQDTKPPIPSPWKSQPKNAATNTPTNTSPTPTTDSATSDYKSSPMKRPREDSLPAIDGQPKNGDKLSVKETSDKVDA